MYPEKVYELKFIPYELKRSISFQVAYLHISTSLSFPKLRYAPQFSADMYVTESSWWIVEQDFRTIHINQMFKGKEISATYYRTEFTLNNGKWITDREYLKWFCNRLVGFNYDFNE